jgi:hypothetical protein
MLIVGVVVVLGMIEVVVVGWVVERVCLCVLLSLQSEVFVLCL